MDTDLGAVLNVALPAIAFALLVIMMMVRKELGPFSGLSAGGKWMLSGAFGMGVLAFTFKMAVAVAMAGMPGRTISPLIAAYDLPPAAPASDTDAFNDRAPALRYVWQALPEAAPAPPDNPTTPEKAALGRRLFVDTLLSADRTLSCASCHDLYGRAGGDGRRTASGIGGQVGGRNAPTVWNAAFQSVLFWDGRAPSLEEQAKGPILNPIEMGMPSAAELERRLAADASYRAEFARVFGAGRPITIDLVARAIAAYERTLITPDTPYDRFVRGDVAALTAAQLRGMALFESVGCVTCHLGPGFSDASLLDGRMPLRIFPANANPYETKYRLLADGGATGGREVRGVWRIASLRNVALTGPYFHNGSVDKLADAVRIMATAQLAAVVDAASPPSRRIEWSPGERSFIRTERRVLGDSEVEDIVAFLGALSSDSLVAAAKKSAP
jgi:cytochrome c peroxidase